MINQVRPLFCFAGWQNCLYHKILQPPRRGQDSSVMTWFLFPVPDGPLNQGRHVLKGKALKMCVCVCVCALVDVGVYNTLAHMLTNISPAGVLVVGDGMVKQPVEHGTLFVSNSCSKVSTSFSSPALVWVTLLRWMKQRTKEIPAPVVS